LGSPKKYSNETKFRICEGLPDKYVMRETLYYVTFVNCYCQLLKVVVVITCFLILQKIILEYY